MEEKLLEFIKGEFSADPGQPITSSTKLISSGMIDSFSLVSLQTFIEKEFGKRVPASRMTAQSFDTVRNMVEVIQKF